MSVCASWLRAFAEVSPKLGGRPSRVRSWVRIIIAPTPQENPETTAWGTLDTYRPRRSRQNASMKTAATRQTLADPPIPCILTAEAMNGTVTLDVPPISTGFRPRKAVMGAVTIDVHSPISGGKPINLAMARP